MHGQIAMGRKRKTGKRYPGGKIITERDIDTRPIAASMPHRQSVPEPIRHDARAESPFGRLLLNGHITPKQYQAGLMYRDIVNRYRALIDCPSESPPSMAGIIV